MMPTAKYGSLGSKERCSNKVIAAIFVVSLVSAAGLVTGLIFFLFPPKSTPYRIQPPSASVVDNITLSSPLPPDPSCDWRRAASPAQICSHDTEAEGERKCSKYIDVVTRGRFPEHDDDDGPGPPADKEWPDGLAPVYICARNNTRTALVGPFTSRVQEWHTIHVFLSLLSPGDRIVKYTGDTVSANDTTTPIGYPPLHMHHIHVYANYTPHWFETHGDYPLDAHGYSLSSPPPGSCIVVKDEPPTKVFAQVNDVRFSTGTAMAGGSAGGTPTEYERLSLEALRARAPAYRWYFRIQFELEPGSSSGPPPLDRHDYGALGAASAQLGAASAQASAAVGAASSAALGAVSSTIGGIITPRASAAAARGAARARAEAEAARANACKPVHKLILMYPMDEHVSSDVLQRFDCGNRQSLFTYSIVLPSSGTVVPPSWMHTHRARHGGYVLLRGEHTLFSLVAGAPNASSAVENLTAAHIEYTTLLEDVSAMPASARVASLRRAVLERAGASLLCHDDERQPTSFAINETGDGLGGHFDRQGATVCEPFSFRADEKVTAFSFVNPNWALDLKVFSQHTMLFLLFTPDPAAAEPPPLVTQQLPHEYRVLDLDRNLYDARSLHCKPSYQPPGRGSHHWHHTSGLNCTVETEGAELDEAPHQPGRWAGSWPLLGSVLRLPTWL